MGVIAESFATRYSRLVEGTLEGLGAPDDKILYEVSAQRVQMPCAADEDDEHYHEVAALVIVWSVERADGFYWPSTIHIPIEDAPADNGLVQQIIAEAWESMLSGQIEDQLSDLDDAMDGIAAEHEK